MSSIRNYINLVESEQVPDDSIIGKAEYDATWHEYHFDGEELSETGKTGKRFKTGVAVKELKSSQSPGRRIWIDDERNVYPD